MASSILSARYVAWCGLVIAGCSIPVLLGTHPPLYDYPFYIARLFILTELPTNAFLSEHYSASSFLIPNIGMELVLLPLTSILPLEVAFDVFLILIFASIITGTVFLHRTLFDQPSLWPLVAGVFVINWIFLFGFLTYLLGVGLFLWAIAAWIRLSRESTRYRFLYGSLMAVGLFFVHLVAFGLYAIAVFGFELQRALKSVHGHDRRSLPSAVRTMAYSCVQFVIPAILYFLSSTRNTGVAAGIDGIHYEFAKKLATPIITLTSGIPWLDVLMGLTVVGSALVVFFAGRIRISANIIGAGICLILVYLALPHILRPAAFVDSRIPIAMLFFLIASLQISFPKRFGGVILVAIISAFFVVKTIAVTREWREHDTLIAEYFQAFDRIEDHSTMFIAMQDVPPSWVRKHYVWRVGSPRSRLALPRERCGAPSAAFTGLRALPNPPNRRILAMEPSPSGESRLRAP
jgi:hypothetical protein